MFDLSGRVAVVTGGSAGIGLGIAKALGTAGAAVSIWARGEAKLGDAVAALSDEGIVALPVQCDVTIEADVQTAVVQTVECLGDLDIFVANVGMGGPRISLLDTSLKTWEASLRSNVTSTFLCFREAAKGMVTRAAGGSLIAVSSAASVQASPALHHYAAAKCGLHGLVRSIAHELAPAKIRCNALVPGFTETERIDLESMPIRRIQEITASIPTGRFGIPADLGAAALYLADPTLSYHTGVELFVDGGLSIMAAQNAAAVAWDSALASLGEEA